MPSPPVGGAQAQAGSARPRIPNGCRTESPCGTENRSPKKRGTRHRIAEKKQNTARQPLPRMIAPVPALPARFSPAFAAVVSPAGKGPSLQFYSHSICLCADILPAPVLCSENRGIRRRSPQARGRFHVHPPLRHKAGQFIIIKRYSSPNTDCNGPKYPLDKDRPHLRKSGQPHPAVRSRRRVSSGFGN